MFHYRNFTKLKRFLSLALHAKFLYDCGKKVCLQKLADRPRCNDTCMQIVVCENERNFFKWSYIILVLAFVCRIRINFHKILIFVLCPPHSFTHSIAAQSCSKYIHNSSSSCSLKVADHKTTPDDDL
jgi:hypothetical protein